jgi:O-antigen/teichoic acid export membrane protein
MRSTQRILGAGRAWLGRAINALAIGAGHRSRINRHAIVIGSAWIARCVAAVVQLAIVRVFVNGFGSDDYAVFAVLYSLSNWYLLSDLGVGASVQNFISEHAAKNAAHDAYVLAAGKIAIVLLPAIALLLALFSPWISNRLLHQFAFLPESERGLLVLVSGLIFVGTGVGAIAFKIWYAEGKSQWSNIVPAIAVVIGLIGAWIVSRSDLDHRLLWSTIAFTSPAAIASLGVLAWKSLQALRAKAHNTLAQFEQIGARAFHFWLLTLISASVINVDVIIIAQFLSPGDIVIYSVTTRIFGFSAFFYTSLYAVLWPTFSEAIVRNDLARVRRNLFRALVFSSLWVICFTAVAYFSIGHLIHWLAPDKALLVPANFILLLGLYNLIVTFVYGFGVVLQSMSKLRTLLIFTPIQALINIALLLWLVPKFGIYGATFALTISLSATMLWVLPWRTLKHLTRNPELTPDPGTVRHLEGNER